MAAPISGLLNANNAVTGLEAGSEAVQNFRNLTWALKVALCVLIGWQIIALSCIITTHLLSKFRRLGNRSRSQQRLVLVGNLASTLAFDVINLRIMSRVFGNAGEGAEDIVRCRWLVNCGAIFLGWAYFTNYLYFYMRVLTVDQGVTSTKYLLLRRLVFSATCTYSFASILHALVSTSVLQDIDPSRISSGNTVICFADVPPYWSVLLLCFDSIVSLGFLILFLWPLMDHMKFEETNNKTGSLRKAAKKNLRASLVAIGTTMLTTLFFTGVTYNKSGEEAYYPFLIQIATFVLGLGIKINSLCMLHLCKAWRPWIKENTSIWRRKKVVQPSQESKAVAAL